MLTAVAATIESAIPVRLRTALAALLVLAVMGAFGAALIRETTPFGSGLRDDSFAYLSSAEGLSKLAGYGRWAGDGTFRPMTSFPPLYSALIAAATLPGLSLQQAARLLDGATFGALILLVGLGLLRATRSLPAALFGAAMALASGTLIELHSWALSEGVFFLLALGCLFAAAAYLGQGREGAFYLSAALAALAFLTRYVGVALVLAVPAVFLLGRDLAFPRRLKRAVFFAGLASLPMVLFLLRNLLLTGNAVNRPLPTWHLPDAATLGAGGATVLRWGFLDPGAPRNLALLALAAFVLLFALALIPSGRKLYAGLPGEGAREEEALVALLSAFALAVLAVLFLSMALFDPNVLASFASVNARLLSPTYLAGLLLVAIGLGRLWRSGRLAPRLAAVFVGLLLLYNQASAGRDEVKFLEKNGLGFSSPMWRSSRTLSYLRDLPDVPVFTNDVPALYLLAGRTAMLLPTPEFYPEGRDSAGYRAELEDMRGVLKETGGVLVIVGPGQRQRLSPEHFEDVTKGLVLMAEFGDGLVYADPSSSFLEVGPS